MAFGSPWAWFCRPTVRKRRRGRGRESGGKGGRDLPPSRQADLRSAVDRFIGGRGAGADFGRCSDAAFRPTRGVFVPRGGAGGEWRCDGRRVESGAAFPDRPRRRGGDHRRLAGEGRDAGAGRGTAAGLAITGAVGFGAGFAAGADGRHRRRRLHEAAVRPGRRRPDLRPGRDLGRTCSETEWGGTDTFDVGASARFWSRARAGVRHRGREPAASSGRDGGALPPLGRRVDIASDRYRSRRAGRGGCCTWATTPGRASARASGLGCSSGLAGACSPTSRCCRGARCRGSPPTAPTCA